MATPAKATAPTNKPTVTTTGSGETDASTGTLSAETTPKLAPSVEPVTFGESAEIGPAPSAGEVPDPRTASDTFQEGDQKGYAGLSGFGEDGGPVSGEIAHVDPKNLKVDVTPGVQPHTEADDRLLAAAQLKAPNLTREFVEAYKLTDSDLGAIARGEVPPPPAIGPAHTADLYLTPGGWQQVPPGFTPEQYAAQQTERAAR